MPNWRKRKVVASLIDAVQLTLERALRNVLTVAALQAELFDLMKPILRERRKTTSNKRESFWKRLTCSNLRQ